MKKSFILGIIIALLPFSFITNKASAEWTSSANVGLFSEYRFRGVKQTEDAPAIQGGFDLSHSSGIYLGNWNSNVEFGNTSLEMDFYAGYSFDIGDLNIDIGDLYYYYPDNSGQTPNINSNEVYAIASYGPFSGGYHYFTTEWFGVGDDSGSTYMQINIDLPITEKLTLSAHAGSSDIEGAVGSNYEDYSISAVYAMQNGFDLGLDYIQNNGNGCTSSACSSGAVISISKSF